jgi:methylase of polypeptide subunit release factors
MKRVNYPEFDFREYKASEGRHAIHDYPAMLHYKLVSELVKMYSTAESVVYDPFCGSGVSIVESLRIGRSAIGTDINPLALLIADVRASNFDIKEVYDYLKIMEKQWEILVPDIPYETTNCRIKFKSNF